MQLNRRIALAALAGLALAPTVPGPVRAEERLATPAASAPDGTVDRIAMLVYPGMTALDLVGPHHFLASMSGAQVDLVTIGADLSPVPSDLGLAIQPTATFGTCPEDLALLFVPGGTMGTLAAARDPATIEFLRDRGSRARYVTSVCTGSLVLGAAGLLRGRKATSHWIVRDLLSQFEAIPTHGRVVRDGNVVTGAGVSAGLDLGASLVAEVRGMLDAEAVLLVSEYDPEPPFPGGSPETARAEIVSMIEQGLAPFVAQARMLRMAA
ncbi:ThiJ/PfpI family protein [Rubellimicrobium mesophilum DSM 19309]|uniref:ThiJ/PfpI family protein n=1 Tax=Rubellimicrobium mesophilum DSM 19309 TaxID=442562 RepID=A0A017HIC8_9RHOB|nr:DJ-1/PfpI family protein [Rubellimicrobium mesophilum]EYD74272.1 ThiJ/PfpI family protein [Rubellimicrobium mesophilum DSM 19309]